MNAICCTEKPMKHFLHTLKARKNLQEAGDLTMFTHLLLPLVSRKTAIMIKNRRRLSFVKYY